MTKAEAAKIVAVILAAYPAQRARMTAHDVNATSSAYERLLVDLDFAAVDAAVEKLTATSKFMPTIAEIREATAALYIGDVAAGGEAWGVVLRAIGRYGRNRTPGVDFAFGDPPDPVALEVVRALNWRELCDSENQAADRARFIELYNQLAAKARRGAVSNSLPAQQKFRALQEQAEQDRKRLAEAQEDDDEAPQAKSLGQVLQLAGAPDPSARGIALHDADLELVDTEEPVALVGLEPRIGEPAHHASVVIACSRAAWKLGVRLGMPQAQAAKLSPAIRVIWRDRRGAA